MKKVLVIFSVLIITLLCSISVFAMDTDDSGMWEYQTYGSGVELTSYKGTQTDVYVPSKITKGETEYSVIKLGDELFKGNTSLNSATLGEGITEIGASAFEGATNLVCIVTPESLTTIGTKAFSGCSSFNSVILYRNVISIDSDAFNNCEKLKIYCEENSTAHLFAVNNNIPYVLISESATPTLVTIDDVSYYVGNGEVVVISCNKEKKGSVVIPSEINGFPVTEITESAFSQCSGITSVTLPQTITYISKNAFYYCSSLSSINIPSGIKEITEDLFYKTALSYVSLPAGLEKIEKGSFVDTLISSINIPKTVNYIGAQAFWGCSNLRTITIPEGVTELGYQTFAYCYKINNVVLPQSLTTIRGSAFQSCLKLTDVYYNGSKTQWYKVSIGSDNSYLSGATKHYAIKVHVESVALSITEKQVFVGDSVYITANVKPTDADDTTVTWSSDNTSVATVTGSGIINIVGEGEAMLTATTNDGGYTATCKLIAIYPYGEVNGINWSINAEGTLELSGTSAMPDFLLPNSVPWCKYTSSINKILIQDGITNIGDYAFYRINTENIDLPNSIQQIGNYAFAYMNSLVSISIPDSVISIGEYAFYSCVSMKSISFGALVSSIGQYALEGCSSLEEIIVSKDNSCYVAIDGVLYDYGITKIICYPISRQNIKYVVPETVCEIPSSLFKNNRVIEEVVFTKNISSFGEMVFYQCSTIKTVVFENDMEVLPNKTFYNCISLKTVTLPQNLKSLATYSFYGCTSLTEISLFNKLETIENYAFYNCTSLLEVTLPEGLTTLGNYAFYNCQSIREIVIPYGVKSLTPYCFGACISLDSVSVPNGLTRIENWVFYNCASLESISLPESLTYVGYAFADRSALTIIKFNAPEGYWNEIYDYREGYLENVTFYFQIGVVVEGITLNKTETELDIYETEKLSYKFDPVYPTNTNVVWSTSDSQVATVVDGVITAHSTGTAVITVTTEDGGFYSQCTVTVTENYCKLASGRNGNTTWVIYNNGHMIISGRGNITNYTIGTYSGPYWKDYASSIKTVIIEEGITNVSESAFSECVNLKSISIPSTVTEICDSAFYECSALQNIIIPDSVKSIGVCAFAYCNLLEEIRIPNSIKNIGRMAFYECRNLKDVYVDDMSVWCNITFGGTGYDSPLAYADNFYIGNKINKNIIIPNTATVIGNYLFNKSDIESIIIPSSVKSIGEAAFSQCHNLKKIVLSEGLESIGESAFLMASNWNGPSALKSIVIPRSVTSISSNAFEDDTFLYVYKDSYAQKFAIENRLLYFVLPDRYNPEIAYGSSITGTATYTDGTVASGATVEILYDDGTVKESVTTDANGNYEFTYAEVGRYTIRVTDTSGNTASEIVSVKRMNVFDVYLAGETDLVLKKGYNVSGTVSPSTATIILADTSGNIIKSIDTTDGTFAFGDVPRGSYIIKAENNNGSATTEIYVSNEDVTGISLEIQAQSATISGDAKIENRDGTFTTKIWVSVDLIDADGNVVASTKTDANGKYTFKNIPVGNYKIVATTSEMRPAYSGNFDKSFELKGYGHVEIVEFSEYSIDPIILREDKINLTSVSGKVTANGTTQDCQVILTNENGDQIAVFITDKNGKYSFINIPDGIYSITAITKADGMGYTVITIDGGFVFGSTDIMVAKSDKISKREETLLSIPDCNTKSEALIYKEAIMAEKAFYDSLSEKEGKELSEEWIEKLFKLVGLISDSNVSTSEGVTVENIESAIASDEIEETISFTLTVSEVTASEAGENGITTEEEYETEKIKDKKGKNKNIAKYYDITFSKDGQNISNIQKQTETNGKLCITMDIPEEYRGHKHYSFIHMHKGEAVTLVDLDDDPNTVTFEIDKFSTFALAYSDVELVGEVEETIYPASITYNAKTGKISVSSTETGTLYIATYNGESLSGVVSYDVVANEPAKEYDFASNQAAFVWDENIRPLCKKHTINN